MLHPFSSRICRLRANDDDIADLHLLQEVVTEAAAIAHRYFGSKSLKVWDKSVDNPVTEADLEVNEFIRRKLMSARPAYGWLSEETTLSDHRRDQAKVWVLDPIDGTKAFINGSPFWCVGAGLVERGEPKVAVVAAPALGQCYTAVKYGGAKRNGIIIRVSDQSSIQGCRMVATEEMFNHKSWPEIWPDMVFARPKPNATLLRLCAVASGEWDAAMALWRKSDWDLAPGSLIVEEAGGLATTHLGEDYRFNQLIPAQRSLLSAGTKLHSLLKARLDHVQLANPNANETQTSF